ncbi:MAG TPA: hypothetical protein PLM20_06400 [Syntrophomonadaceae bacterium]|nr:hypothetical protein [Syntrophomonadaceae bacterium]HQE23515.1 hypothetical protein [Syntrophomonadaceae bacterium]
MRSAVFEISLVLAAVILGWLKTGWNSLFFIALGLIGFYIVIMVIYMVSKRSAISWSDRLLGVIAIAVWLFIAWTMVQEKQFHLWGLLK